MATQAQGLHHLHKRKRIYKKFEPYPHPNKFIRRYDEFMWLVAIIVPLMAIPQIYKIWVFRSAQDVSLISWTAFMLSGCAWLVYSIIHKDKPLIINSLLWVIFDLLVIIGILLYG